MSVLVCGGKLTYPIKVSTDRLGIIGVSYVEQLGDYLNYNKHIEKVIFLEAVDNPFKEEDVKGFDGDITVITNNESRYEEGKVEQDAELREQRGEQESKDGLTPETLKKVKSVKKLEGLRVSDVQWEIMNS